MAIPATAPPVRPLLPTLAGAVGFGAVVGGVWLVAVITPLLAIVGKVETLALEVTGTPGVVDALAEIVAENDCD